jgi:hypothetical protein
MTSGSSSLPAKRGIHVRTAGTQPGRDPPPPGDHRAGPGLPHATQAIRITRRVRPLTDRRWRTVTVYAVTSLTAAQAHSARLAG